MPEPRFVERATSTDFHAFTILWLNHLKTIPILSLAEKSQVPNQSRDTFLFMLTSLLNPCASVVNVTNGGVAYSKI
ncbi:MAG: hypothetical protein LIP09_05470 [Bacteroidales bacterium]|nr:hypothetical protein [Bacteroidales bacterium]